MMFDPVQRINASSTKSIRKLSDRRRTRLGTPGAYIVGSETTPDLRLKSPDERRQGPCARLLGRVAIEARQRRKRRSSCEGDAAGRSLLEDGYRRRKGAEEEARFERDRRSSARFRRRPRGCAARLPLDRRAQAADGDRYRRCG